MIVGGRIVCLRIDRIAVKGRGAATDIFEVLGFSAGVGEAEREAVRT